MKHALKGESPSDIRSAVDKAMHNLEAVRSKVYHARLLVPSLFLLLPLRLAAA
jgi:hypothetical protein